ncbi:MAG TPA: hypothetical protein VGO55_16375 [Allosphingosinicella sp.]|nr:hypothetical protein [Allosphingosinicella sp.]
MAFLRRIVSPLSRKNFLTGTYGSDIYYPGGSIYGDTIYDPGGDDYYMLSGYSFITDAGGTDTAVMAGYELDDLLFMVFFDTTVVIAALDSSIGVWFEGMVGNSSMGVDYLVLDDVTLNRAEILTLASEFG